MTQNLPIAKKSSLSPSDKNFINLLSKMTNRHGLIAGATGTGKTVTLQVIAEQLSSIGVPTFVADVKGDFSGISQIGGNNPKVADRVKLLGLENSYSPASFPVTFCNKSWDTY
jgi:DNA helicase HerA-like ATPase